MNFDCREMDSRRCASLWTCPGDRKTLTDVSRRSGVGRAAVGEDASNRIRLTSRWQLSNR